MVCGTACSARADANAEMGDSSSGVGGVGICLVNIGVDVGCVVMGAVFVPGLLGCACKEGCSAIEG